MKKFFSLIAAVLFAGSMMAEGLLFEQTYPGNPSEFVNSYSKSFTMTTNGYTLTYANLNNGSDSNGWTEIRAGHKSNATVATITSGAIAEKVSKVIVDFSQVQSADKVNELYLQVADAATFAGATKISATIAKGEVAFVIPEPAENKFYQVALDIQALGGNYNGVIRIDKVQFISPDGGSPIVPTEYDTLTVAQAIAICDTLAEGAQSTEKYYVEGYAVNVAPYSMQYGNQIFFLADENKADSSFQAYGAYPMKEGNVYPVLEGDFVRAFGPLKKYVDTKNGNKVQLEMPNPTVEFISEVEGDRSITPAKVDTITTAQALAIAKALAKPAESGKSTTDTKEYIIGGYAVQVYDKNSDGTWSFFMADEEGAYGEFQASNATTDKDVVKGDYMYLRGYIARRLTNAGKDQYQVYKGTAEHGEPLPLDITEVDVTAALEIGNALVLPEGETNVYAEGTYRVTGWVVSIPTGGSYDPEEGIESFYLSDDKTATRGDFLASQVSIDLEAQIGQQVAVVGRIQKHKSQSGNVSVQIFKGKATNLTRTGIENITLTEKAQKVVVDGVIYIVRDNKMFNLQGAQVR